MKQDWIFFNSHDPFFRRPFGAVLCNTKVVIRLIIAEPVEAVFLKLLGTTGEEKMLPMVAVETSEKQDLYKVELIAPSRPGLLYYYFIAIKDGITYFYGNNDKLYGGVGQLLDTTPFPYQITVYQRAAARPAWFQETVVYQIFVDRFYNGCEGRFLNPKPGSLFHGSWDDTPVYIWNKTGDTILRWDFFGGNLLGIIKKLTYLKELGVGALYLNPIFESPSNHKYDTADYKKIDSMFGDNLIFQELCKKAAKLGIRIILDGVFSHTGSDSIYFNKEGNYPGLGAYQSQDSPYFSWYQFKEYPENYKCWWGHGNLPEVNELDPSYLDFMVNDNDSVVKYWLKMGAKGWRLDVADELPDEFIKKLKAAMEQVDPESILIGEVWEDASNKMSYGQLREYFYGDELDGVMNYPFRQILVNFILGRFDALDVHLALMSLHENYPPFNFFNCLNLIGSHDLPRILTVLGEGPPEKQLSEAEREKYRLGPDQRTLGLQRMRLITLFQMTFPGVPCIYYGDEVGMEGYSDPYNRGPFPWNNQNRELLAWYKKVIGLRNKHAVFRRGDWLSLAPDIYSPSGEKDVYAFARCLGNNLAVVLLNRNTQRAVSLRIDLSRWPLKTFSDLLNDGIQFKLEAGFLDITLLPLEGKVLTGWQPP